MSCKKIGGGAWHKGPRPSRAPLRCRVCRGGCYATALSLHYTGLPQVHSRSAISVLIESTRRPIWIWNVVDKLPIGSRRRMQLNSLILTLALHPLISYRFQVIACRLLVTFSLSIGDSAPLFRPNTLVRGDSLNAPDWLFNVLFAADCIDCA